MATLTAEEVQDLIIARLEAAFPTARVEDGWPQIYLAQNKTWPLITVAPVVDGSIAQRGASQSTVAWDIRLLIKASPGVGKALLSHRRQMRKVLIAQDNFYDRKLLKPVIEPAALEYHEPLPNQPYAGLTMVIETTFAEPY